MLFVTHRHILIASSSLCSTSCLYYNRKWKLHRKDSQSLNEKEFPRVSILKPLVGVDPNLFSNLETFFTMKYPVVRTIAPLVLTKTTFSNDYLFIFFQILQYELLFCISDENDASVMLVKRLMEMYPSVDASIFIGTTRI